MASTVDTSVSRQPRNTPQAAISLISPPPNAPGITSANANIGKLTHKNPIPLSMNVIPRMVYSEITDKINMAIQQPFSISIVSISRNVTTVSRLKNANTASDRCLTVTAATPQKHIAEHRY